MSVSGYRGRNTFRFHTITTNTTTTGGYIFGYTRFIFILMYKLENIKLSVSVEEFQGMDKLTFVAKFDEDSTYQTVRATKELISSAKALDHLWNVVRDRLIAYRSKSK